MKSSWSFIMRSCYRHIAHTYVRRWMFWFAMVMLLLPIFAVLLEMRRPQPQPVAVTPLGMDPALAKLVRDTSVAIAKTRMEAHVGAAQFTLMFAAMYLINVLTHLKQQIASSRAVLVPGYRGPHLVVAAAFILPVLLLWPLLIGTAYHFPAWSVFAVVVPFLTLVLWVCYLSSGVLVAISMLLFFGLYLPLGQRALGAALTQTPWPVSLGLLAVSFAAMFQLTRQFLALREEMPAYSRGVATNRWDIMRSGHAPVPAGTGINYDSPLQRFFARPADRRFDRLGVPPASLRARLGRWSFTSGTSGSSLFLCGAFVLILAAQAGGIMCYTQEYPWGLLLGQVAIFAAVPVLTLAPHIWPTLGYESLRPLRRGAYFRERALAIAAQMAQLWLALTGIVIALTAVLSPATLRLEDFWLAAAGSALFQVPVLALSFWMLRYRSAWCSSVLMGVLFGMLFSTTFALGALRRTCSLPISTLLLIAAAAALLSVMILADAYRRWLRTDLA
jgi:hypothetical protein